LPTRPRVNALSTVSTGTFANAASSAASFTSRSESFADSSFVNFAFLNRLPSRPSKSRAALEERPNDSAKSLKMVLHQMTLSIIKQVYSNRLVRLVNILD
jgi:hypothetical protein